MATCNGDPGRLEVTDRAGVPGLILRDFIGNPLAGKSVQEGERHAHFLARMNTNLNYLISVIWFILWIVALVDCIRGNSPNKVVWIIMIILLPFLGSILYFLLGRSRVV